MTSIFYDWYSNNTKVKVKVKNLICIVKEKNKKRVHYTSNIRFIKGGR
uniref:Uncharacterized protein n=1 Tax=viral metagenome TaxID=1070528 RepID=A0A6M3JJV5_9ZZZZ